MDQLSTLPLSEFFGLFAPKFVVGTTYTASLTFFESVVLPKIDKSQLHGAVVVVDECGFVRATEEAGALSAATTTYSMALAPHQHSFHAKVWVMVAEEEFAILCGSGNLTHSGFIGNNELFDVIRIRKGGRNRALASEFARFFLSIGDLWKNFDDDAVPARALIGACALQMVKIANGQETEASRDIYFLASFGGSFPSQIRARIPGQITKLRVAAPFFGGSHVGLSHLRSKFPEAEVHVFPAMHGNAIDIPSKPNGETRLKLKLWNSKSGFAHLKLYGLAGPGEAWLFNGSVNCTESALSGSNIEAGILRRVPNEAFDFYFEPDGPLPLLEQLSFDVAGKERRWIRLWAANIGNEVRVSLDPSEAQSMPLCRVTVEWASGSQVSSAKFAEAFAKPVWIVPWSAFDRHGKSGSRCSIFRLTGWDSSGMERHGIAFIDEVHMLSASPLQRNAWAGVQAVLSGRGVPNVAELEAVFELFGKVLDGDSRIVPSEGNDEAKRTALDSNRDRPAPVPLWPPQVALGRGQGLGRSLGNDSWFQTMLDALLRSDWSPRTGIVEDDEIEVDERVKRAKAAARKAAADAAEHTLAKFYRFRDRLHAMVPNETSAHRVAPVSVGYFYLALEALGAAKRVDPKATEIDLLILVTEYARVLFDSRTQKANYTPTTMSPYRTRVFPPLLWDTGYRLSTRLDDSLVVFNLALFGYLKFRADKPFPKRQWLTFRLAARLTDILSLQFITAAIAVCVRLFDPDKKDTEITSKLSEAFASLDAIRWKDEVGYSRLDQLVKRGNKLISVDPHVRFCPQSGCPRITSTEFDGLVVLSPVQCPHCRAVLVPHQLFDAFKDHGANNNT